MSTNTSKLRNKLSKLHDSLDTLEAELEPLLAQPLAETLVALDTIQQAKLQVVIPYVVYDLVFVYLKTRGIDPTTHPVVTELDRVRQYFEKIKHAEASSVEQKQKVGLDKDAAGRFIKHAIAQAKNASLADTAEPETQPPAAGPSTERVPARVTSKMQARAEYERTLQELGDQEEDELAVFDEDAGTDEERPVDDVDGALARDKGKHRVSAGIAQGNGQDQVSASRRKRPRIDPFTGYDILSPPGSTNDRENSISVPTSLGGPEDSRSSKSKRKAKKP